MKKQWVAIRTDADGEEEAFGPFVNEAAIDEWAEALKDEPFRRLLLTPMSDPDSWSPTIEGTAVELN